MLPSIIPAKLARSLEPFDDKDWLFELKHDGFWSLAYLENGHCRLVSRHKNVYKSFETLRNALAGLRSKSAILDGEIVCLDAEGCSQFKRASVPQRRAVFFACVMNHEADSNDRRFQRKERRNQTEMGPAMSRPVPGVQPFN